MLRGALPTCIALLLLAAPVLAEDDPEVGTLPAPDPAVKETDEPQVGAIDAEQMLAWLDMLRERFFAGPERSSDGDTDSPDGGQGSDEPRDGGDGNLAQAARERLQQQADEDLAKALERVNLEGPRALVEKTMDDVSDEPASLSLPAQLLGPGTQASSSGAKPASTGGAEPPISATTALIVAGATAAAASLAAFWLAGSTGAVGGAAAKGGAQGVRHIYSPLFTRFEKDTVLDHPNREALYSLISRHPGIRLQDLCDETELSRTAVTHHLRLLEQQHLVVSRRVGRSRHYYENGGRYAREQKEAYAVLQNERSKEIADCIEANPGIVQKALCEALGLRASIAHWHVRRLQEAELVDAVRRGRNVAYYPSEALASMAD